MVLAELSGCLSPGYATHIVVSHPSARFKGIATKDSVPEVVVGYGAFFVQGCLRLRSLRRVSDAQRPTVLRGLGGVRGRGPAHSNEPVESTRPGVQVRPVPDGHANEARASHRELLEHERPLGAPGAGPAVQPQGVAGPANAARFSAAAEMERALSL